jgi:adapter protein MecA 1/2
MKIEKINENQIRCTLTKEDLEERGIKLSELAYGSTKAKDLFRDMMGIASQDFGFEAEDMPLRIEAVPVNAERIILIITKVDNPDELDTRFSRFTAQDGESAQEGKGNGASAESASDILNLFSAAKEKLQNREKPDRQRTAAKAAVALAEVTRLYMFPNLSAVARAAEVVDGFYHGENTLYKDERDGNYYLFLKKSAHTPQEFNKLCNVFSEYAVQKFCSASTEAYYAEHFKCIVEKNALQTLSSL